MSPDPSTEALREWLEDWTVGRLERPQFKNPGELRAAVRALFDERDALAARLNQAEEKIDAEIARFEELRERYIGTDDHSHLLRIQARTYVDALKFARAALAASSAGEAGG